MSSGKTKYGVSEQAPMGWSELRDGLADHLPAGAIHLNKRFSQLQQHADHVELHFTDGTSVEAKIVVGADGCFSKIRQQTLGDGLPDFTVSCLNHISLLLQGCSPNQTTTMDWLPEQQLGFPYVTKLTHMTDCLAHLFPNLVLQTPVLRPCCDRPCCTRAM
jgi:2-polyprenyl-6-methoxyphenol hydroxylase-like FAD-dependent oxidoreductase